MKKRLLKKLFACLSGRQAFIITVMMFSVLPEFIIAQCGPGKIRVCNENGKHCKCVTAPPRPCRACYFSYPQSAAISFSIDKPEKISVKIYDATGRLIKTLADSGMPQGEHQIAWNRTDEAGHTVNAGIYFLQFSAGNKSETKKLSVIN